MENVIMNGFTDLSEEALMETDGGVITAAALIPVIGIAAVASLFGVGIWCIATEMQTAKTNRQMDEKLRLMGIDPETGQRFANW